MATYVSKYFCRVAFLSNHKVSASGTNNVIFPTFLQNVIWQNYEKHTQNPFVVYTLAYLVSLL